jgi:hypothetical protein
VHSVVRAAGVLAVLHGFAGRCRRLVGELPGEMVGAVARSRAIVDRTLSSHIPTVKRMMGTYLRLVWIQAVFVLATASAVIFYALGLLPTGQCP